MITVKSFKLILLLSLFSYSAVGFSKTIIVTDIDDTIKKANSMGGIGGVWHFLRKKPYEYTRDLFNEIKASEISAGEEVTFYYVSAAPSYTFDAPEWLVKNNFPIGPTYLKTKENGGETYVYKYRTIKTIIENELKKDPKLKIIFFGDNSQHDAKVYFDLRENMTLSNSIIFIRDVSTEATDFDPKLPIVKLSDVTYFFSEVELIGNSDLSFMSKKLSKDITNGYRAQNLIPLYTLDTLTDRLKRICENKHFLLTENITASCKAQAKIDANDFWMEYYGRY
jgi:hypothetical protein